MRKALAISTAVGVAILIVPSVSIGSNASSSTYRLSASMTTSQVVTPRNRPWRVPASVRNAHGSFAGTMKTSGKRGILRWRISYSAVGSNPLRIADIHFGKPGRFGPVLARLCGPCKATQTGTKKLSAQAVRSIKSGSAWITIITGTYPNGVIRGQIKSAAF